MELKKFLLIKPLKQLHSFQGKKHQFKSCDKNANQVHKLLILSNLWRMSILLLRITTLFLDPRVSRHHICRYWSNRRSRKFFVNCVNFSVNNLNYEQNLHKVTHIAKCLHKMFNKWSNLHILHKSLCILEYLRYFVGNLILLRFTLTCVNCLGTTLWSLNIFDKYDV